IRTRVDGSDPLGWGMREEAAASFQRSRAFRIVAPAREGDRSARREVDVVARYAEDDLLMSGWELGAREHLGGRPAMVRVPLGRGQVVLIGFRPQFRGQPHGTFKLVFNSILAATMERVPGGESMTPE
ncbi:MAG: peptidase M14, partial [Gemmatimonadetes bacterium]|nr:peptidase M14 [Gemmatimonadota bacterium]NIR80554.1 peptidase M14 [Gemmatimonadota bacterium]NIT89319.1 peptidase M14 [Gemmatimonadota bacterium]NIU33124.1 peptidase M14 [Gemmatimonadota bacterium]NIU37489.1 peptidase M14 [Gemmatimonadota bacterium]